MSECVPWANEACVELTLVNTLFPDLLTQMMGFSKRLHAVTNRAVQQDEEKSVLVSHLHLTPLRSLSSNDAELNTY